MSASVLFLCFLVLACGSICSHHQMDTVNVPLKMNQKLWLFSSCYKHVCVSTEAVAKHVQTSDTPMDGWQMVSALELWCISNWPIFINTFVNVIIWIRSSRRYCPSQSTLVIFLVLLPLLLCRPLAFCMGVYFFYFFTLPFSFIFYQAPVLHLHHFLLFSVWRWSSPKDI